MAKQRKRTGELAAVSDVGWPSLFHPERSDRALSRPFGSSGHLDMGPGDGKPKAEPIYLYGPGGKRIEVDRTKDCAEIARLVAQGWEFIPKG
jgi:hypothetical protein